jgi:hypothetical protein
LRRTFSRSDRLLLCALWQSCDVAPGSFELFMKDREDPLPDAARLDELGVADKGTLFVLQRQGACVLLCAERAGGARVLLYSYSSVGLRNAHAQSGAGRSAAVIPSS